MIDIKERAQRVTISIEEARAAAVRLGDRNGTAIGEDAYELAQHVLAQDDGESARLELAGRISTLRASLASIEHEAGQALRGAPKSTPFAEIRVCDCRAKGPGCGEFCCGGPSECGCDCHDVVPSDAGLDAARDQIEKRGPLRDDEIRAGGHEPPVDPAHPAQTVVPGTIEEASRAAIDSLWEPDAKAFIDYTTSRGIGPREFAAHVRAFRDAYRGERNADWDGVFRSWLDAHLKNASKAAQPVEASPPAPAGPKARAPEVETPVESWEPPMGLLLELGVPQPDRGLPFGRDFATVQTMLARFKAENAGKSAKRWAPTFRTWMAAQKA